MLKTQLEDLSAISASGGARRDRTDDLMLAKHALSQLSYGPEGAMSAAADQGPPHARHPRMVGLGGFEPPTSRLSSARSNQLSYKPEPCSTPVFGIDPVTGLVREERETKTAASRSIGLTGRNIPSDPIGKPKLP